jgi:hypothetical protein
MEAFGCDLTIDLVCHDENITRDGVVIRTSARRRPRGPMYESLLFDGNLLSPSATVFKRDKALELGGFEEGDAYLTVEDYDFWMRFSKRCRIEFLPRVLGEYVLVERAASRRIVYHHTRLEGMLRTHLDAYLRDHSTPIARLRARRRLARVYRSAARQLISYGESAGDQRAFVQRMLATYPFEPRNLAVALLWAARGLRAPAEAHS